MKLPYPIVLVLTSTVIITAANKACCPGENMYDSQAKKCTEKWSENDANISLHCKTRLISEVYNEYEPNSCHLRMFNHPEYNSTTTLYILCYDESYWEIQDGLTKAGLVLMTISVVFLILTVAVYVILPELRDLQGICILHALCSLISNHLSILIIHLSDLSDVECKLFATAMYFGFIYTFWWLLILSFHIWRTTVKSNSHKNFNWSLTYHIMGTLGPLLCLTILLIAEHHPSNIFDEFRPNFGKSSCWFHDDSQTWTFFYGPLVVILTVNLMFYVWTIVHLWKQMRTSQNRALKYRVRLFTTLYIIMGLTWIIELITFAYKNKIGSIPMHILFIFIPDIINRIQGVLVFLILVVSRKRVKRLLAKKTFFNRQFFPLAWTNLHDEEMDSEQIKEGQTQYDETEIAPMQAT